MKTLVIYYSRSGTTKKVGDALARALTGDCEDIRDTKNRKGLWGWITSGRDAAGRRLTTLKEIRLNPAEYDLVVIGTPVFASKMASAVRTYIAQHKSKLKKVAFFCTAGGDGYDGCLDDMEEVVGLKPVARTGLTREEIKTDLYQEKIRSYTLALQKY